MAEVTKKAQNATSNRAIRRRNQAAVWVDPAELVEWDRNPRKITAVAVSKVAGSIQRFGFAAPIVAQRGTNRVLAGHTRLRAARLLKLDEVPVRYLDVTDADATAYALADNRLGELVEWDEEELDKLLGELDADGFDLASLGWDPEPEPEPGPEPEAAEGAAIAVMDGPPSSVRGQLYDLGPHRLFCGDCRDAGDVAALVTEPVHIAFTSPPYASQRIYDDESGFKPIAPDDYVAWFESVQSNVARVLAPDGSWFVNIKAHCDEGERSLYVLDLTLAHVRGWGWKFIDEFCWERGGVPGKWPNRFKNAWEPVFHFARNTRIKLRHEQVTHPTDETIEYIPHNTKTHSGFISGSSGGRGSGDALPSNVIHVAVGAAQIAADDVKHTATFPVGLPQFFIRAFTDPADVVYDPFLGSGTTLIAAAADGRRCFGMEISPLYCDLIRRRWTRWAREHGQDPGSGQLDG